MKMLKTVYFVLVFIVNIYAASRSELLNLEEDAITFGSGPNQVYVFIDPMCSKSKDYISLISTEEKLLKKNSYYVFLHRLEKFKSDKLINYIYESESPKEALLELIITDELIESQQVVQSVQEKRTRIDKVADSTGMTRRPYLLIYPANSNVCKVSEGTAPCMFDW